MKNIFIVSHSGKIEGAADYFEDYLIRAGNIVVKLSHPLDAYAGNFTVLSQNRKEIKKWKRFNFSLLNLILDFISSIFYTLKYSFDTYIGANNFDVLPAIVARKIFRKKIRKIIYFASDFSENRFASSLLNKIYYFVEKISIKHADLIISNTFRAESRRLSLGLDRSKSLVVPNGVHLDNPVFDRKDLNKNNFIFVGSVTKESGLFDLLEVLKPKIDKFVLIGDGDDWNRVIGYLTENIKDAEIYHKKGHDFVLDKLRNFCGFGLAPYNTGRGYIYFGSSLKINEYLACGLPIITTDVLEIAPSIKNKKLGIVWDGINHADLLKEVDAFDTTAFEEKAKEFYSEYSHDNLYSRIAL